MQFKDLNCDIRDLKSLSLLEPTDHDSAVLKAFRHFFSEHIRFDSDLDAGHAALSRRMTPDDRIVPLWASFRRGLVDRVPALATRAS